MKALNNHTRRLAAYLTAGVGAGCIAGQADAALVVTFFGPGAQSPSSSPPTPAGIDIGSTFGYGGLYTVDSATATAAYGDSVYFTRGTDISSISSFGYGEYFRSGGGRNGALLNSDQNYANISFNAGGTDDGVYEAVAQFYLDGAGGGYLVAVARNDDNTALSISAGKAAIDAVPEPSSLALLALGAGGLVARRKRAAA